MFPINSPTRQFPTSTKQKTSGQKPCIHKLGLDAFGGLGLYYHFGITQIYDLGLAHVPVPNNTEIFLVATLLIF